MVSGISRGNLGSIESISDSEFYIFHIMYTVLLCGDLLWFYYEFPDYDSSIQLIFTIIFQGCFTGAASMVIIVILLGTPFLTWVNFEPSIYK